MDRLLEEDETAQKGFYEPTKDRFSEKDGFLNFFVDRVQANVDTMISLVDGGKEGQRLDGMTKGSIARNEKQLSQRWRNSMKIETERFRRRNGLVKKPLHKMTLEEQWDEVLSESSLPFSNSLVENLVDGNDSSSEAYDVVTPIFGFRTEEGRLLNIDLDNIMNDGSRHISNQSSAENAEYEPTPSPFDDGPRVTKRDVERQIDPHTESILRTIALFYAITKKEWAMIDRNKDWEFEIGAVDSENALQLDEVHDFQGDNQGEDEADQHEIDQVHELMRDIRSKKYHLTTTESNLLLAKILTSMDTPVDIMLSQSLQLYGEMKLLRETGREESGPDATTYRMLILALSRRMMALGEAVSLSQEMMESSVELTPEAFLDGMHACISKSDMDAAWKMIFFARNDHQGKPFRPSIAAYALMLEMMKQRNLQEDAIDLFKRVEEVRKPCQLLTNHRRPPFLIIVALLSPSILFK